jgi:KEOPS complex subunit Cgi121
MKVTGMDAGDCMIIQFGIEIENPEEYLTRVREISACFGVCIVLFNAEMMAGIPHVCSALQHAFRAFDNGTAISNSPEMEALLYASGSRQCQTGVRFGIHPGRNFAYLCICPGNEDALTEVLKDGDVVEGDWDSISPKKMTRLMDLFGITPAELEVAGRSRITDLILERVALLEVCR